MASKYDLIEFLKVENVRPMKTHSNGKLECFASMHKYAKHAYKHFRMKVLNTNVADVPKLHFCDTLASRNLLVTEINAKEKCYDKFFKVRIDNYPPDESKAREEYLAKWIKFQRELLNADLESVPAVTFQP